MSSNFEEMDSINYTCGIIRPVKKAHRIGNKTIVVIDDSLVEKLSIDELSTWFEEEEHGNGILLKIYKDHGLNGEERK